MTDPTHQRVSHFLALPTELIFEVAEYLSIANLNALVQACRQTCAILTGSLYMKGSDHPHGDQPSTLLWAAKSGNLGTLRNVIKYCIGESLTGDTGNKALLLAIENENVETFYTLIYHGVSPDISLPPQRDGEKGFSGLAKILLDGGTDISKVNRHLKKLRADPDMVEVLFHESDEMASPKDWTELVPNALLSLENDLVKKSLYRHIGRGDCGHGSTKLHLMTGMKMLKSIRRLLSRGADATARDGYARTPMHLLAYDYDAEIYEALAEQGADINATDNKGESPLFRAMSKYGCSDMALRLITNGAHDVAARGGDLLIEAMEGKKGEEIVQALLDAGVVNMAAHQTPKLLFYAARENYPDIVQQLLDHGVDPTTLARQRSDTSDAITPLMAASSVKHERIFHMLLARTNDFEVQSTYGRTALSFALENGSKEMIRLLLDRTSNIDTQDNDGNTPLIYAAQYQSIEVVSWLLERCQSINLSNCDNKTALYYAVQRNEHQMVQLLLEAGAGTESYVCANRSLLMIAAEQGHVDTVRTLLEWPEIRTARSIQESLSMAVSNEHVPVVEFLLQQGADLDEIKSSPNKTHLMVAFYKGNEALAHVLLKYRYFNNMGPALIPAVRKGWESIVIQLLAKDAFLDVDSRDQSTRTALLWAATGGSQAIVLELLARGAHPFIADDRDWIALDYAAEAGHDDIVRILVEWGERWTDSLPEAYFEMPLIQAAKKGHAGIVDYFLFKYADVDYQVWFRTALSYAAEKGHRETAEVLLRHGADVDSRDSTCRTPLSWAAEAGHSGVAEVLIRAGADIVCSDATGRTPLSWALADGHDSVVKVLYEKLIT